jgi:hypothetical protein
MGVPFGNGFRLVLTFPVIDGNRFILEQIVRDARYFHLGSEELFMKDPG